MQLKTNQRQKKKKKTKPTDEEIFWESGREKICKKGTMENTDKMYKVLNRSKGKLF